jgi:hypothetical protein
MSYQRLTTHSLEKLPPHNIEAEQAALGAVLLDNDALLEFGAIAHPYDFYRPSHRYILEAMQHVNGRGDTIDLLTLRDELERMGKLEDAGGASYLAALVDQVPTAANIEAHARIIHRTALARHLLNVCIETATRLYEDKEDVNQIADELRGAIVETTVRRKFDWLLWNGSSKLSISPTRYLDYLQQAGFRMVSLNNQLQVVRPSDLDIEGPNVIAECLETGKINYSIKQHVIQDLTEAHHTPALDLLLVKHQYFEEKFLTGLNASEKHPINISVTSPEIEDDEHTMHLFYLNGFRRIHRSQGETFVPWRDVSQDVTIWEDLVIRRHYRGTYSPEPITHSDETPFKTFVKKLTTSEWVDEEGNTREVKNTHIAEYAIPYALHKFLPSIGRKSVIVIDDRPRFMPDGRLGKGVFVKLLRYYHYYNPDLPMDNGIVITEDGRSFKQDNTFKFQRATPRTRLLILEDMDEKVKFVSFLSQITEGAIVEGKYMKRFSFAPNRTPKFVFTMNSPNFGEGESELDRILLIPVGTYFREHSITQTCGGFLYEGWDDEQWALCDNYIGALCQRYFHTDIQSLKTDTTVFNSHKLLLKLNHALIDRLDILLKREKPYPLKHLKIELKELGYIGKFEQDLQTYMKLRDCYRYSNRSDGRYGCRFNKKYEYALYLLPVGSKPNTDQMELSIDEETDNDSDNEN